MIPSRTKVLFFLAPCFLHSPNAWADKVIMKDGKIYQGHIIGETSHSVLISNAPQDPSPHLLEMREIFTIVRESHPAEATPDRNRYATLETHLTGNIFSSKDLTLDASPGIHVGGGFRLHPLAEVDAELDWIPAQSGNLAMTDGAQTREYERFYAYGGGFAARIFPFYRKRGWKWTPYVMAGYQWSKLAAKNAGDDLTGSTWEGGIGCLWPWKGNFYWDSRALWRRTSYDAARFLLRDGTLDPPIRVATVTLFLGLQYRFL